MIGAFLRGSLALAGYCIAFLGSGCQTGVPWWPLNDECFVKANQKQMQRVSEVWGGLSEEYAIATPDFISDRLTGQGWGERIDWPLRRNDMIKQVDGCRKRGFRRVHLDGSFTESPRSEEGYITKWDVVKALPASEWKGLIHTILIERDGKEMVIDVDRFLDETGGHK